MVWKKSLYIFAVLSVFWMITDKSRADDGLIAQKLIKGERHKVVKIIDGDTVILEDGSSVRLVGIQAPKISLGQPGFKDWPLAGVAKNTLSDLVLDNHVTLYYGGARTDRYQRHLAHLFLDEGRWVQGVLLRTGMARVYSFADNRALVEDMLRLEKHAESAHRGIWKLEFYHCRPQEDAFEYLDSFQLVKGIILDVATVRGTTYLNFGADWKKDFTIVIKRAQMRKFEKAGIFLQDLKDKPVRIRGWLKYYNGPMIDLTHPEQLEIL